jgi:hypothetical protein
MRGLICIALGFILTPVAAAGEPATPPAGTVVPTDEMPVTVIEMPPPADPAVPPTTTTTSDPDSCRIPGSVRGSEEYLLWWMKSGRLPPLATRAVGTPPVLGQPGTRDLFGGTLDLDERSGGRFVLGMPFNDSCTTGLELGYWFLGSRTSGFEAGGTANPNGAMIGRPIIDAATGRETSVPIASPGFQSGLLQVSWTARAQGFEVNAVTDLFSGSRWQIDGIAGYRFIDLHEGLNLTQYGGIVGPLDGPPLTALARADDFDCDNRYQGGQIGLRGDLRKGPLFVELTGKVAFGQMTEVVRVSGVTGITPPFQIQTVQPGGLLALGTNSGRITREVFAVVPEAIARAGSTCGDHARFFVGYNFLLLSDVARPGDQIDRTINLSQVPGMLGINPPGVPDRPALVVQRSSIWLQGILIGFEGKW